MKLMPDFIGIGVVKCATSWTFKQLSAHPEIQTGPKKELRFFGNSNANLQKYQNHWRKCNKICGEWTPDYFTNLDAPKQIKRLAPKAILLCNLRNPVERAWSDFKFAKYHGHIPNSISFYDSFFGNHVLGKKKATIKKRGLYASRLEFWFSAEHKINILFFDNLVANPVQFMSNVYALVGVDPSFVSPGIHQSISTSAYKQYTANFSLDPKTRRQIQAFYLPSIKRLEKLLNIDLSHWKKP